MTTKPNAKNSSRHSEPAHVFRRKALQLAVASCFLSTTSAYAVTLADYNYATKAAGMVTSDTMSGSTRTIANLNGAILNWSGLNINAGETLTFQQLNAASKVLNRVGGGNMTSIMGTLSSNGQVFLINNAGIAIGKGATINVAGLVTSSLNITDDDFIAGHNRFNADIAHPGSVSNAGSITTPNGGFVYLLAPQVENSAGGIITTPSGEAILAAGNSVELVDSADPSLRVRVSAKSADVNLSQMMTQSNGDIFSVLNSGKVSANTAVVGQNGKIQFRSAGTLQTTATSVVEARGDANTDGGLIRGFANGDGTYAGSFDISGRNGGKLETSAAYLHLDPNLAIAAWALNPKGRGGTWLLDPYDFTINAPEASIINSAFSTDGMANVTIDTGSPISFGIASSGGTAGNIIINSAITAAYDNGGSAYPQSLTLAADGTVTINAPISNGADSVLSVAITSDRSGYGGGGIAFNDSIHIGGSFSAFTDSGNISMSGTNIIQASSVMLDANGDIGSSANLIRTDTPDLTVGSRSSVDNAFVRDTQAVNSANFNVQDTGLLVIDNGMTYGGSISMTSASGTSFVASSGDLTLNSSYGGTIHFNGDGVVDVNGDLSLLGNNYINSSSGDLRVSAANLTLDNGDWIGAYGGNLTVAVDHNITMTNGAYFAAYAGVNVSAGGQLSMTNSSIAAYGGDLNVSANSFTMDSSNIASYGGDINISANTINMSNYSSMDAYGGNLSIGNTSALGAASLTMNNSQLYGGDVLILAQHVNLANSSYVSGFDIGINFFPGDVAALTATSASATAAVAFFTNADVNISSNSSISADHSLGIRTGDLNVDASTGFANLDASSGSMALIAAGSINVKGGNGGYGSDIFASQELFLKAGKQLNVETSSDGTGYARVDVSSSSTLFMSFPLIPKNGWNVDGVDNAFSSKINPSTGIFVAGLPGVLKTNTFVTYGGVTNDSSVKANLSLQAAQLLQTTGQGSTVLSDDDRADQIFGSGEDDKDSGSGKNSKGKKETPKQCGSS